MKKYIASAAIITTILISSTGFAGVDDDDVLYGTGRFTHDTLSSSPGVPFDSREAIRMGQQGNDSDVLYGNQKVRASGSVPQDPVAYDRDNRDDQLYRRS